LVTGSRGVIGQEVCKLLADAGFKVTGSRRIHQGQSKLPEVVLDPWTTIETFGAKFDAIIHLAGEYSNDLGLSRQSSIFNSNLGLAASISELLVSQPVPVIAVGSYFESAMKENQPWSYYSISKIAARNLLVRGCTRSQVQLDYVFLYDTYGGSRNRMKFIDQLVNAYDQGLSLPASFGEQVLNLTHVADVAGFLVNLLSKPKNYTWQIRYSQIKSDETYTLREIAKIAQETFGYEIEIHWGDFPYRDREVFRLWDCAPNLTSFEKKYTLHKYLSELTSKISEDQQIE
jgi:nucleoside-diphosphate-sugar epimerase